MSKSSLEAAAEAAAKVNAMLIAKGKLKLSSSQIKPKIGNNFANNRSKIAGDLVTAEVDINDAPLSARNLLTRGHMQDEICKLSGAAISTRGRYMTPEERQNIATPECRPLYLNVQASSFEAVKVAVRRIQEIIDQEVLSSGLPKSPTVGVVTYPQNCTNGTVNTGFQANHVPTGSHFVQDKVFIGLEQAPSEYPVREKILGPGGSFLQHIRSETGASVMLRGKGSGFLEPTSGREAFEPLYIHITHPKPEGLQAAKALAINLVETAHVEFAQWQQAQQQSVLQPLTSIVLPQATPVAYQNQVMVTPAVLPGTLPAGTGVVATGIQIPASVAAPVAGTTLTTGIPSLIHASMPTLVSPVSVVSSVPMSVQAISPTVISYPTYVANTNSIIARPANPVLARPAAPAVSILSVVPTLPTGAAYTSARPRPAYQIQPVVYTNVPPLQPANLAQSPMPATSMVVTLTEPTNYPVQSRFTHPPPITQSELAKHRYFSNMNISVPSSVNTAPTYCLQESNVNHPTELQPRRGPSNPPQQSDPQDRELMPPPPTTLTSTPSSAKEKEVREFSPEDEGQQRKRLKGALGGIASIYGSDDSDEEDEEDTLASKS
ncbi:KH homology domain-containing protein 4-like isoform X1 [Argiope bruennichi]|uniref:KH homology domain-containing protein 4-like isoform X1 n=2 Tax=Argiope bruennichi TaxID=94029 RepID=UPI002493E332|nr:KH homology domain-containing protein 4-like isoform X1 [Argiope bruennichi]XP_055941421.1 KH homology domain-containing protein 4-like isoform X1 [Argiope bruennichi]